MNPCRNSEDSGKNRAAETVRMAAMNWDTVLEDRDMEILDYLARLAAAIVAWVRLLAAPTRQRAGVALVATGALLAY